MFAEQSNHISSAGSDICNWIYFRCTPARNMIAMIRIWWIQSWFCTQKNNNSNECQRVILASVPISILNSIIWWNSDWVPILFAFDFIWHGKTEILFEKYSNEQNRERCPYPIRFWTINMECFSKSVCTCNKLNFYSMRNTNRFI